MTWLAVCVLLGNLCQIEVPRPSLEGAEPQVANRLNELAAVVSESLDNADTWGRYGITLHAHSYDREANVAYAEAQRLAPGEFKWPYFRAVLLAKTDVEEALPLLERAILLDPEYGPAHDRRGVILKEIGRRDEAEKAFREAVRLFPRSPPANLHIGQIELQNGDTAAAIRHLEIARRSWPQDIAVLATLSRAFAQQGDRDRARTLAEAARGGRKMPQVTDTRLNEVANAGIKLSSFLKRADIYSRGGQPESAEAELKKALQLGHDPAQLNDVLARVQVNLRKYEESIKSGQRALAAGRNDPVLHHTIGIALLQLRRLDQAEQSVDTGLALEPNHAQLLQLKGRIAAVRGRDEEAVAIWTSALEQHEDSLTRRMRGQALSRLGRHDDAIEDLKALASKNSSDWQAWLALGDAYGKAGSYEKALAAYEQASDGAKVPLPGRSAAVVLVQQRRFDEARKRLEALTLRWPRNPGPANDLAWLLATCPDDQIRDGAQALKLIEPVIHQTKRSVPAMLDTYAAALAETNQFEQAKAVMDEAIRLLPANDQAQRETYSNRRRAYLEKKPWRSD